MQVFPSLHLLVTVPWAPTLKMLNLPQRLQEEHLLTSLTRLAAKFPAHQALACQKALLELKLCKLEDVVATVLPFTTEGEVGAARWAMHLAAHIYWLEGHLDQVHALASLLLC